MTYPMRSEKCDFPAGIHAEQMNMTNYAYSMPGHQMDENRNENVCGNKEIRLQSSGTQTVQKVDASTMTDPLQIDFRLTSEYLARCSNALGLPYVTKSEENKPTHNCPEILQKINYDIKPQHFNGMLVYNCPECPYRFEERGALQEHLEEHRQRPHVCDICGASLKRKEHLGRHKQGHNKDRPYQCGMCCKAFKRNEHLARHMITHSGSKNQVCTQCGKAFYRKDHLKKHIQSHNNGTNKVKVASQNPAAGPNGEEALNSLAMMMQTEAPPFFILRT